MIPAVAARMSLGMLLSFFVVGTTFADERLPPQTVVASRGGATVTLEDVDASLLRLPVRQRADAMNSPKRIEELINQLLLTRQLANVGVEQGLDRDPLVKHAMRMVAGGRRMLFSALLAPLRERHGAAALARVEKCLATYLQEIAPDYPDPAQRPKFLYFPDLPTTRFFGRELFPWYEALEAHADAIRAEMLEVLSEDSGLEPFLGHFDDKLALQDHLRGDNGEPAWNAFFFHRHGVRNDANAARCPVTIAALEATPLCRVRDHSPEVCFSVLTPGSHILPHRGVTNTRLVTHLPLVVPEGDLALHVSGETMRWQEGRCFTFDDTFEHEAWNRSSETRVVVLLDVWNPYLTEVEREAVAALTAGIGDFNREAGL